MTDNSDTIALNLALEGRDTTWMTCPACGLMFETETKKIEKEIPMQFNLTITGDLTPESAPMIAQLLTGGAGSVITADEIRRGTILDTAAAGLPRADPANERPPDKPAPEDAAPLTTEELTTRIREKGLALKRAGKSDVMRDAIKSAGHEKFSDVPTDKYPALWEVLKDAG